jgi:hypothetical protein
MFAEKGRRSLPRLETYWAPSVSAVSAVSANIRLVWEGMTVSNTPAYYVKAKITTAKSFYSIGYSTIKLLMTFFDVL